MKLSRPLVFTSSSYALDDGLNYSRWADLGRCKRGIRSESSPSSLFFTQERTDQDYIAQDRSDIIDERSRTPDLQLPPILLMARDETQINLDSAGSGHSAQPAKCLGRPGFRVDSEDTPNSEV